MDDFILVALPVEQGPREGQLVHYVGKVVAFEEGRTRLSVSFLRLKSPFIRDTLVFPGIPDESSVTLEQCKGVLAVQKGSTQRQTTIVKITSPIYGYEMR